MVMTGRITGKNDVSLGWNRTDRELAATGP
jgi:hypothetical protein